MTSPLKAIPELSLETQLLERILREVAIGEVIAYPVLSAVIDRDVQDEARHYLMSARRRLLREPTRMVFEAVRGIGMKRLDDTGKIGAGQWHLRRVRTQARMAQVKTMAVEDFAALPADLQRTHNVTVAQAGMLLHVTGQAATRKLTARIDVPAPTLPLRACLAAMKPCL